MQKIIFLTCFVLEITRGVGGGAGGKNYPPLVTSRTKQVRNMIFCMALPQPFNVHKRAQPESG